MRIVAATDQKSLQKRRYTYALGKPGIKKTYVVFRSQKRTGQTHQITKKARNYSTLKIG